MSSTNTVRLKKTMAIIGLIWFSYVIFHLLSLLTFYSGEAAFNALYAAFEASALYHILVLALIASLAFHAYVAITRQLANNKSKGVGYHKSYPGEIPRSVAWTGAAILLSFIVFHFVQMKTLDEANLYQQLVSILANPLMLVIYALGTFALCAHLHHGLTSVLQTLGVSPKLYNSWAIAIVAILFIGFISIPVSVYVK